MSIKTQKYLVSSLITFVTGFALVFVGNIDSLTLESFKNGAYVGIIFTAVRAGIKALVEWFLATQATK